MKGKRQSTIEEHEKRSQIEYDLARNVALRVVAKRYGVSVAAAHRHKAKMPPQLRAATLAEALDASADMAKLREEESRGILVSLHMQRARLLLAQDAVMETREHDKVARISAAIHRNIELVGKYLGEFAAVSVHTEVQLLITPQYLQLRAALVKALRRHPEAARDVAQVLRSVEETAARAPVTIEGGADVH